MNLKVDVCFHFTSESVQTAGGDLRRLKEAAQAVGFQLVSARVEPAPPREPNRGPTYYVPLDDDGSAAEG
ncbi:MAG TPA: hypothetical protein VFW80_07795 [Gaiellaceae bacterium]|nr:hypothetical protein [Gaiellaceae bacterium]